MEKQLKVLVLTNSQSIMGDITLEGDTFKVEKPVMFMPTQEGLAMAPINPVTKQFETVEINADRVVYVLTPEDDVEDSYDKQVRNPSPLVLPKEKKILQSTTH